MTDLIHLLHRAVWGPWLLAIFLGAGGYLTLRSRGFQIRGFGTWMGAVSYTHLHFSVKHQIDPMSLLAGSKQQTVRKIGSGVCIFHINRFLRAGNDNGFGRVLN